MCKYKVKDVFTFSADCRNVGPVVLLDDLNHGLGLQFVRWNDTHKVTKTVFVGQISTGGTVTDLRDVEKLQQVLHLDGNGAGAGPDDADQDLPLRTWRPVAGAVARGVTRSVASATNSILARNVHHCLRGQFGGGNGVSNEFQCLFQSHWSVPIFSHFGHGYVTLSYISIANSALSPHSIQPSNYANRSFIKRTSQMLLSSFVSCRQRCQISLSFSCNFFSFFKSF